MAKKPLINLGISPDSGTGDSARKGGAKINALFADIYSQFGDNPIQMDPSKDGYGYRQEFGEYEYYVGELHPAGKYTLVEFKTSALAVRTSGTNKSGWGVDTSGEFVDSTSSNIPDIYEDSDWYFLSRGEMINADLTSVSSGESINLVLPLAAPGDTIIIRDIFDTWGDKNINLWATPYRFSTTTQVTDWASATGKTYPGDAAVSINGTAAPFHGWDSPDETTYPELTQTVSSDTSPGYSITPLTSSRAELTATYQDYETGWVISRRSLDEGAEIDDLYSRIETLEATAGTDSDWITRQITSAVSGATDSDWVYQIISDMISHKVDSDYVLSIIADSDWILRKIYEKAELDSDQLEVRLNERLTYLIDRLNTDSDRIDSIAGTTVGSMPEDINAKVGDLWYDSDTTRLYVRIETESGDQVWVDASPAPRSQVTMSGTAPSGTNTVGDFWVNSDSALRVWNGTDWEIIYDSDYAISHITDNLIDELFDTSTNLHQSLLATIKKYDVDSDWILNEISSASISAAAAVATSIDSEWIINLLASDSDQRESQFKSYQVLVSNLFDSEYSARIELSNELTALKDSIDSDWITRQITTAVNSDAPDSDWISKQINTLIQNKVDSDFVANLVADSEWILSAIDEKVELLLDSDTLIELFQDSEYIQVLIGNPQFIRAVSEQVIDSDFIAQYIIPSINVTTDNKLDGGSF